MLRLAKMFAISTLLLVCVSLHSESAAERNEQTAEHSSATEKLPKLSTILQHKLPFHYRRADLGDVLFDLEARGGLKTAFPKPLDGTFTFDFNVQQAAVNEILKRVAKAGGLELEFRNRTAVFWKPADDAELRALEILVKADKPTPGRARALEDLAQLSDPLIKLLGKPNLQHVAIDALEKIGDSRATAPIVKLLDEKTPRIRYKAAMYLLNIGDIRGADVVWVTYKKLDPQYHDWAIQILAQAGDQRAIDLLVANLKPDGTRRPRDAADTLATVRDVKTIPALIQALMIENVDASFAAAAAIAEMRHPKATDHAALLLKHEDVKMRVWGARILGWMRDPNGTDALIDALDDEDALVRQHASQALVAIGDRRSVSAALAMLKDPARDVRVYTAKSLGGVRDRKVIDALFVTLGDANGFVRQAVGKALLMTHDPAVIRRLAMLASSNSSDIKGYSARRAFTPAGNPQLWGYRADACVMDELVMLMNDKSSEVRSKAAGALGSMTDPCAIPPLMTALKDRAAIVRKTARHMLKYWYSQDPRVKKTLAG